MENETFETGIQLIKESYFQAVNAKDVEISKLKNDLNRRELKIDDLQRKVEKLIDDIQRISQENAILTSQAFKLNNFRMNILSSIDEKDVEELNSKKSFNSTSSQGTVHENGLNTYTSSFGLKDSSLNHERTNPCNSQSQGSGQNFFFKAKERLPVEKFRTLVDIVEKFNKKEKSKEETLKIAESFLQDYQDLLEDFQALFLK